MSPEARHRTLVVANRTASTQRLLDEIERRAAAQPTDFVLLVPAARGADWMPEEALEALRAAARGPNGLLSPNVEAIAGADDPFEAVKTALDDGHFDDVIISTRPRRTSEWLRRDLPRRVRELGTPVTVISQPRESRLTVQNTMLGGQG